MVKRRIRDSDDWRKDFFGDFFGDFDGEFQKINERMYRIFDNVMKHDREMQGEPYIYGFTFKVGPEGKPSFQEFGNVVPHGRGYIGSEEPGAREPIMDVSEDKENIYLTFELPGVSKESIDLKVDESTVTIRVDEQSRKYYKEVPLSSEIVTDSASAKFVNGILDLVLKKKKGSATNGKKISIE